MTYAGKKIISPLDLFTFPEGTIINVGGFPFQLVNATFVSGNESNYRLALSHLEISSDNPVQAASPDK